MRASARHLVTGDGSPVLVIGDSWSVGLGQDDLGRSWAGRLPGRGARRRLLRVRVQRPREHAADASPSHDRAPTALALRPALVVVEGGLNDYDQPAAAIDRGFRDLMADLAGHPVVVVGPADAPPAPRAVPRVDAPARRGSRRSTASPTSARATSTSPTWTTGCTSPTDGHRDFGDAVAERIADLTPTRPAVLAR